MALLNILRQFNWVDIFFVIVLLRICYIAVKNGFQVEIFKVLGTISAIYLSLHYYVVFPDYIIKSVGIKNIHLEYLAFSSFILLAILGYLIFRLLSKVFSRFIHMEAVSSLNKWGSLILGAARSFLFASLIIFIFVITPAGYFKDSVSNSYSGRRLLGVAPAAYAWLWNSIMCKFRPQEKFNDAILKIQTNLAQK